MFKIEEKLGLAFWIRVLC